MVARMRAKRLSLLAAQGRRHRTWLQAHRRGPAPRTVRRPHAALRRPDRRLPHAAPALGRHRPHAAALFALESPPRMAHGAATAVAC